MVKCLQVLLLYATVIFITVAGRPSNSTNVSLTTNEIRFIKGVRQGRVDEQDEYRLPEDIVDVLNYDIVLRPEFIDERKITTSGKVTISGKFLQKTNTISLHAGKNLQIQEVSIEGVGVKGLSTKRDENTELLIITFERTVLEENGSEEGSEEFTLIITYTTTFSGCVDGFDENVYIVDGKPKRLFSLTDLQPTIARKVFPCFDEPNFKATFKLTMYTPQGYGVLSNTPLDKTESNSGTLETLKHVFQKTPPMSTHSLAFMVYQEDSYGSAPYGTISMLSDSRVFSWAPTDDVKSKRVDYSLTTGAELLGVLEAYLNSSFCDPNYICNVNNVVIPDLRVRSSPKWGFLHSMPVDSRETTEADKYQAVKSIAKGLAQQWFGNLVTPSWWDDAWLTGGLAEYLGYWAMDKVNDDWRAMERLVVEQQLSALEDDGWNTAPALSDTTEIDHKIGGLTDSKGSSIFMMLSKIQKIEEVHQNVLRKLIELKKYDTTNSNDLKSTITEELTKLDFDLATFLSSWTSNPGYPLIEVEVNKKKKRAYVSQKKFTYETDQQRAKMSYYVPLHGRGEDEPTTLFLEGDEKDYFKDINSDTYFLLTNTGHYRVKYDEENREKLREKLYTQMQEHTDSKYDITPVDRARLVDDSLNLARASVLNYGDVLPLVAYLSEETDYVPWVAAFRGLGFLERMLVNANTVNNNTDAGSGPFKEFMNHILSAVYNKLGFTNSGTHLDILLREQVLRAACSAGNADCLDKAAAAFRSYIDENKRPDPDLHQIVLCYGLKAEEAKQNTLSQETQSDDSGERDVVGKYDWTKLYEKLDKLTIDTERMAVISGLGCSTSKENLNTYVRNIFQKSYLKANEGPSVLKAVYKNPLGVDVVLEIFHQNETLEYFSNTYGERTTVTILKDLANYIVTDEQMEKFTVCSKEWEVDCDELQKAAFNNNKWFTEHLSEVNGALKDNIQPRQQVAANNQYTSRNGSGKRILNSIYSHEIQSLTV